MNNKAENKYIELLNSLGIIWQIPRFKTFQLKKTTYTPDFYLPKENVYIEIIGTRGGYIQNRNKIKEFRKLYPDIQLKILDSKGQPYPPRNSRIKNYGKAFSSISLQLTQAEGHLVEQLNAKGITQVEIFRQGLALCQKAEHKPLKAPAKAIKRAKEIVR